MYNFFSIARHDNRDLHQPESRLLEVKESVAREGYSMITGGTKRKHEGDPKNSKRKSKGNPDTSAQGREEDGFGNPSVQRKVTSAGYTLVPPISDEFKPLTPVSRHSPVAQDIWSHSGSSKLKPTMCKATSPSGVLVVLKIITGSNERQFLQSLSDIKAPSNHTIPLLDAIDLSIKETVIVLPWKFPLDEVLRRRNRSDDVVSLCFQFLEGVDFLHQHNVAHCDLKPGNVVVDTKSQSEDSPRLWIIDFELALVCRERGNNVGRLVWDATVDRPRARVYERANSAVQPNPG